MFLPPIFRVSLLGVLMAFGGIVAQPVEAQDLAVTKTAPATVTVGQNLTYSLSLENLGTSASYNVVLNDPLPDNTTFVSARQTGGPNAQISTPSVGASGTVSASIFSLPPTSAIGSAPTNFVAANGVVYFIVHNSGYGSALWKTDGTATGTTLLRNFYDSPNDAGISELVNVNGTLFFAAQTGTYDRELWKSDGTPAGTVRVKDIFPGTDNASNPANLTNVNGTLFFKATDGVNGIELWKSDGTTEGTVLVKDIYPGSNGSMPSNFANVNGTLFFSALDGANGFELWKSDGTANGTVLVKDIAPGQYSSSLPTLLTNVNGTLFFSANTSASGQELWKSDGTSEGTVLVKDIVPSTSSSNPANLTNVNGTLFFSATGQYDGTELWKSDGTTDGTIEVKDIYPGSSSSPDSFGVMNGTLFFSANDGATGRELWKSDGTANGTVLVKDIYPGMGANPQSYYSSSPGNLTAINGTLFFSATDGTTGPELWKSDGTTEGTVLVKDIYPGASGSTPGFLTPVNGTIVFRATDNVTGTELWKTDGTATGTTLVKDIIGRPTFEIVVKVGSGALGTTLSNTATIRPNSGYPDPNSANDSATAKTSVGEIGSLVVNRADDVSAADNQTTLREAIAYAGTLAGTPTVTFDPNVFATANTITLGGTQLVLDHNLIIQGTGARLLTIDANQKSSVFSINPGTDVALNGLTLSGATQSAIYNQGTVTITACALSNNQSIYGAALLNDYTKPSKATILNSTFNNNHTTAGFNGPDFGSAIFNGGQLVVTNCTFTGNRSIQGGVINNNAGTTTLNNCTVSDNTANSSAAVAGTNLTLNNCIVAGNSGNDVYSNATVNGDYNILGVVSQTTLAGTHNQVGVTNPKLDTLKNNGGPTDTMALLAGSPAINAGSTTLATDQRGMARDSLPDIGAYENNAPVVVSVSPNNPSDNVGASRTFSLSVKDEDGLSDIREVWFMANTQLDWSQGATFIYLRASNQLYLRDGDHFNGPITPGTGTLSNSAVTVEGASVTVTPGADAKTLSLSLTLQTKSGIVGANKLWGRVQDNEDAVDPASVAGQFGFVNKGSWTVLAQQPPSVSVAPGSKNTSTAVTVGTEFNFTLDLTDPNGVGDLNSGYILINSPGNLDWTNGFTLVYIPSTNRLYLRTTDGSNFLGGNVIGQSSGTLENDAGSVRLDGCSVTSINNGVRLVVPVTFKNAFVGDRQVWTRAEDKAGTVSSDSDTPLGFKTEGLLVIGGTNQATPQASVGVAGTSAGKGTTTSLTSGTETTFTLNLSDADGASDLTSAYILINSPGNLDWSNGFTLVYIPSTNRLYLRKTDGSDFLGGVVVGQSSGTLENDAGSVRLDGCSVTRTATGVVLSLAVTPKAAFAGTRQIWSRVEDNSGNVQAGNDAQLGFNTEGKLQISTPSAPASVPASPSAPVS